MPKRIRKFIALIWVLVLVLSIAALNPPSSNLDSQSGKVYPLQPKIQQPAPEVARCYEFLHEVLRQTGFEPTKTRETDSGPLQPGGPVSCYLMAYGTDDKGNSTIGIVLEAVEAYPSEEQQCVLASEAIDPPYTSEMTTFHDYEARTIYLSENIGSAVTPRTHEIKDLSWCMYKWGRNYEFRASTNSSATELFGAAREVEPIAEIMLGLMDQYFPLIQTNDAVILEETATSNTGMSPAIVATNESGSENPADEENGQPSSANDGAASPLLKTILIAGLIAVGVAVAGLAAWMIIRASARGAKKVPTAYTPPTAPPMTPPQVNSTSETVLNPSRIPSPPVSTSAETVFNPRVQVPPAPITSTDSSQEKGSPPAGQPPSQVATGPMFPPAPLPSTPTGNIGKSNPPADETISLANSPFRQPPMPPVPPTTDKDASKEKQISPKPAAAADQPPKAIVPPTPPIPPLPNVPPPLSMPVPPPLKSKENKGK